MENNQQTIPIEIVYGNAQQQYIEKLTVPLGTTVQQALAQSTELIKKFPQMDIDPKQIGIFGKHTTMDAIVEADSRIEIYRPLVIDPKQARRQRAKHQS
jgi:putative ubiquitin-RnfH superfamily antitoxin RatB of RatAB toxin-antitoxin module